MINWKRTLQRVFDSPSLKTVFSVVLPIISGVVSGTFVAEITDSSGMHWSHFYKTWSFWGLLLLTGLIFIYNRLLYQHDKEIMNFSDTDFCIAYMRSKCLPEAAERYKLMIREGDGGDLAKVMAEIRKSLR